MAKVLEVKVVEVKGRYRVFMKTDVPLHVDSAEWMFLALCMKNSGIAIYPDDEDKFLVQAGSGSFTDYLEAKHESEAVGEALPEDGVLDGDKG